jgi:ParB family chromosome partitioning protein
MHISFIIKETSMSETLVTIPLDQLKRAAINVRKTGRDADIGQLAASIEVHGLLENLLVRLVRAGSDDAEPLYEVIAGGRRLAALKLLVKRKKMAADYPVPCRVLEEGEVSTFVEVSLAENIQRSPLHPADQFDAFSKLQQGGLSAEEIAARFGIPAKVVMQRLKLGAVSPRLMAAYRADELMLDQLMAFTITDDHAAQEALWFDTPYSDRSPQSIRRHLTSSLVEGGDRRAIFIGVKAYEAAGGTLVRDLFQPESDGYFSDSQLLDRLVIEKLEAAAENVRSEGWSWVEIMPETDYGALSRFGRLKPEEVPLSAENEARLEELAERYDELVVALEEQQDEAAAAELSRVNDEMIGLEVQQRCWHPDTKKAAGVVLSLTPDGELKIDEGLLRPEDRRNTSENGEANSQGSKGTKGSRDPNAYSNSLLTDLSAHRTVALREKLAQEPRVALVTLVHRLARPLFFRSYASPCANIQPSFADLGNFSKTVGESPAAVALLTRHESWCKVLPEEDRLWIWLLEADQTVLLDLLAYCVALTLDAVYRKNETQSTCLTESRDIAKAVSLDMADWWQPTRALIFDHLTKGQIMEAVAEVISPSTAKYLAEMKRADMAGRAEELLRGSRWLPLTLRAEAEEIPSDTPSEIAAE